MRSAFGKDIARSITHSLGRFLALAAIVALGTGFYAGLRMTGPDMRLAADKYYDDTNLMDIRVLSTLGLTDDDLQALREIDGVESVMGAYETDVMATINEKQYAVRVHSLPASALESETDESGAVASADGNYLNRLVLAEGRWPESAGECVISADTVMHAPTSVGDSVFITEGVRDIDEVLPTRAYTIVGFVHASYYATSSSLGSTSLGSGSIQQVMYVPESDFVSAASATSDASATPDANSTSDASAALDASITPDASAASDANDTPYAEAFITVAGAAAEPATSDAYRARIAEVEAAIEEIAPLREQLRADELRVDAQEELDAKRSELEQARAEATAQLDEAKRQLDEAAATIAASEGAIATGQASYESGVAQLNQQRAAAEAQSAAEQARLASAWSAVGMSYEQAVSYVAGQQQLMASESATLAAKEAALAQLQPGTPEHVALQQEILILQGQIAGQQAQLVGLQTLIVQQDALGGSASQLAAAEQKLSQTAAQLESARAQLEQGKADYEVGRADYEQKKADAETRFAEAEESMASAQQQIDSLDALSWYVLDRDQNHGVKSFEADASRIDSIASVFPFIFFLVAALVALTTMTRMVEEERVLIGTYKALGYSRRRIASKYLIYAAIASGTGSIVGIAALSQVLPAVIQRAYAIIYSVPAGPLPIDVGLASLAAGLGMGVTLVATWAAAYATVLERPALLMLPRSPKAGKRILLERAAPLWHRLSFSWKVTFRNLFRYKKRFIMAVVGIAGCTALLLTGLGLSDAINDIIAKQFGDITRYNTIVVAQGDIDEESAAALEDALDDETFITGYTRVVREGALAGSSIDDTLSVQLIVPEEPDALGRFVDLRERVGQASLQVGADGVVISEKLATLLGAKVGDTIALFDQDAAGNAMKGQHNVVVTGIAENYVYYYVFMGPALYERVWGEPPSFTSVFASATTDANLRTQFSEKVRAIDGVKTVTYNDETISTYESMLSSVNMIVVVLVVAAAALAFIVLYNLTNINITERQREIATLKVLGFTPREVDAYIYRETMLLSIIGCAVGLVLGVFMEGFVVVTAEVDQVMFGRDIHAMSFVLAFLLTLLFTVFVMLAMRRKLARIDMVESLKSNE